ncbi:MAG: type II toxin-antitoxin system VapC family toxin [Burkholderiales bacterium]
MHLLDTNICIFVLNRGPGFERIIRRMDGLSRGDVLVSSVSAAELQFGAWASARKQDNLLRLERFLAEFEVLPFEENAARAYGQLRAALKELGTLIGPLDTLIAGHSLSIGATLVTNNLREFQRVPGLRAEDWS